MPEIFQTLGGISGLVALLSWFGKLERTVKQHSRLVRDEYEDLTTWAKDDLQQEAAALHAVKNDLAARNLLHSGEHGYQLRRVRDEFAQRWRDRSKASKRRLAELKEAEGVTVRWWRKIRRVPWPEDPAAEEVEVITAAWEDEQMRLDAVRLEVEPFLPPPQG